MDVDRFTYNYSMNAIEEDGEFMAYLSLSNVHCILNRLNELYNENQDLKTIIKEK